MRQVAPGLFQLRGLVPNLINAYVMDGYLVDARTRLARRRILRELDGVDLHAHVLTHVHADHQGASKAVCEARGLELWCPEGEVAAMETGEWGLGQQPRNLDTNLQRRFWKGPPHPVARALREGDTVGSFTVLEAPGHSPGHIVYWRESDRILVAGDVINTINTTTGLPQVKEPPRKYTPDPARNRESIRRLAELRPELICVGHGRPIDGERFTRFVEQKLPPARTTP
ncbi:MAG: MBL fold metallo-hydrolase [Thermoleophilaceae bacterium]|nr:MBL fold metallo-hydrolase [Thermoleophilaceae bacterium]